MPHGPSALALMIVCAGLAAPAAADPPRPAYTVESRWIVNTQIPASGATSLTLTLQGRATWLEPFPPDGIYGTPGNLRNVRYGDYGIAGLVYGPAGASQPSTIQSSPGTALQRGAWDLDPEVGYIERGASTGHIRAGGYSEHAFRFFSLGTSDALDNAVGNGNAADQSNGYFAASNVLMGMNFIRSDDRQPIGHRRNLLDADGGSLWLDIYRIELIVDRPVVVGGSDVQVSFDGYFRAAFADLQVGTTWALVYGDPGQTSSDIMFSSATLRFGFATVPSPSTTLLGGLALAAGSRRRR